MNAKDELGQLLMIGIEGPRLTKTERTFLRTVAPSGLTYFRRNVESPRQLAMLSSEIHDLLPREFPPLIAIDQEGGRVHRLDPPFTVFPGNDFLARDFKRRGRLDLVRAAVAAQAIELRAIGVNYNFTPVADIHTNPKNPIIGERRTFGTTAANVSKLVGETVRAYRQEKMISCAKHFPGHGDTFSDSHKALPRVNTSRATLLRREILPFRAAIRAGVPTIMTAHVIYTTIDRRRPATLSSYFLKDLLRSKLGFKGVCVSDDLEMAAISAHHSLADAALEAIDAGVDLLLVCKSLDEAACIFDRLFKAHDRKEMDPARFREALRRVAVLKKTYLARRKFPVSARISTQGWPAHRRIAELIVHRGS